MLLVVGLVQMCRLFLFIDRDQGAAPSYDCTLVQSLHGHVPTIFQFFQICVVCRVAIELLMRLFGTMVREPETVLLSLS